MYVYTGLVKDIVLVGNSIFIIDKNDYRRIKFNIKSLQQGNFSPKIENLYDYDLSSYYFIAGYSNSD